MVDLCIAILHDFSQWFHTLCFSRPTFETPQLQIFSLRNFPCRWTWWWILPPMASWSPMKTRFTMTYHDDGPGWSVIDLIDLIGWFDIDLVGASRGFGCPWLVVWMMNHTWPVFWGIYRNQSSQARQMRSGHLRRMCFQMGLSEHRVPKFWWSKLSPLFMAIRLGV